jgi:hypothetical protein
MEPYENSIGPGIDEESSTDYADHTDKNGFEYVEFQSG